MKKSVMLHAWLVQPKLHKTEQRQTQDSQSLRTSAACRKVSPTRFMVAFATMSLGSLGMPWLGMPWLSEENVIMFDNDFFAISEVEVS